MANELAAMATMPSGATTTVVAICAPQMAMCSNPIGNEIRKDLRNVSRLGRKLPRSPTNFSMGERRHRYHIIPPAVTSSANTVPNIAPFTPRPAPSGKYYSEPLHMPRRKDQEEVEHDIQQAHHYIQHGGHAHIPTATQHASCKKVQLQGRQE